MSNGELMADSRASVDNWLSWYKFIEEVWKYFEEDETFGIEDITWFITELTTTFRINIPDDWVRIRFQIELIIQYVIDHKNDPAWSHIVTFAMLIMGLIELIRGLD